MKQLTFVALGLCALLYLAAVAGAQTQDPFAADPQLAKFVNQSVEDPVHPALIRVQIEFIEMAHERLTELMSGKAASSDDLLRGKVAELVKKGEVRMPLIYTVRTSSQVLMQDGRYRLVSALTPQSDDGFPDFDRKLMLFARADVVKIGK